MSLEGTGYKPSTMTQSTTNSIKRVADDVIYVMYNRLNNVLTKCVGIGQPKPVCRLDVNGRIKCESIQVNSITNPYVPQYGIIMWAGSGSDLSPGWYFCNGQVVIRNGVSYTTPDLRGRFIVGEGQSDANLNQNGSMPTFTRDSTGGNYSKIIASNNLPDHAHVGTTFDAGKHNHGGATGDAGKHNHGGATGAAGGHDHGGATGSGGAASIGTVVTKVSTTSKKVIADAAGGLTVTDVSQTTLNASLANHNHSITEVGNHSHSIAEVLNHNHTITEVLDHNHAITITGTKLADGTTNVTNDRFDVTPPYYVLAYIILVGV